eukprot:4200972-Pleurochrysis_carterae.AAC.2
MSRLHFQARSGHRAQVAFARFLSHSLRFNRAWRGVKERARPHASAFWRLGRATSGIFITLLRQTPYDPAPHIVIG